MPKKTGDDAVISELGNWNVASDFVREKIMKPLIKIDYYEDIAARGFESIEMDVFNWQAPPNALVRIKGMQWMISEMNKLILNTKFALKKSGTKEQIMKLKESIDKIKTILPKLSKKIVDNIEGTEKIVIRDEILFDDVLDRLRTIKSNINEPLNKNHLIFVDSEEFDPQKYKEQIMKQATERG